MATATTMTTVTAAATSRIQKAIADCQNAGAGKQLPAPARF